MKLPNFLEDADLNDLRARMGGAELGSYRLSVNPYRFTMGELEELLHAGIDIRYLGDVRALPDRTLAYKDRRVVVYLRDLPVGRAFGSAMQSAVYHVAECPTLHGLRAVDAAAQFVVSAREDGVFETNLVEGGLQSVSFERLLVCEACLLELAFDGYSPAMTPAERIRTRHAFTVSTFFERYRRTLVAEPVPE